MSKKTTRKALFGSVLALVLCVALLVGSTFAWFTDSASSAVNNIQAGKLDIVLEYSIDGSTWEDAEGKTLNFKTADNRSDILWEPGCTYELPEIRVRNNGNLALKYDLVINGIIGDAKLLEAIEWTATVGNTTTELDKLNGNLLPNAKTEAIVLSGHMKEEAGNEYQNLTIEGISISVVATQDTVEYDSFNNTYDKGAPWTGEVPEEVPPADDNGVITIDTAGDLAAFAASVNSGNPYTGETIKLGANIDLNGIAWTPIGTTSNPFNGNFYGEGYTISNLYVQGGSWVGLFGYVKNAAHIEGVTIDGANVSGNDYVGAVLGGGYLAKNCVKGCIVKNAKIVAEPYLLSDGVTYDGGAKAGAVVGYAINGNIIGNSAINCSITAYRDLGSIAGMVSGEDRAVSVSGNNVDDVTLKYRDMNGAAYEGNKVNGNMGNTIGRTSNVSNADTIDADNTVGTVTRTVEIKWIDGGIEYTKDVDTGVTTLYLVPADYEGTTVNVAEGVDTIGSYAFAFNNNIETIVLSSSVTTLNDRAFRDTSASTVVLNEGLTNISYQAFRNASNVTTVSIPSTVTTISKEAFQLSGITSLTIPATVTTIEYGACRDMKALETVLIEGNVNLPGYAFRSCTNLKKVIITGDDVTFDKGQIFTNYDTGKADNITVYVANNTVKERLEAANTATGYTIIVAGVATEDTELDSAIEAGNSVIVLGSGNYIIPDSAQGKTLTIIGNGETVIATQDDGSYEGCDYSLDGATVTFENITINTDSTTYTGYARLNATYNNCIINGTYTLYGDSIFNNCTFNVSGDSYNIWTWGAPNATFNNCTFNCSGKAILLYGGTNTVLNVTNCVFNDANDYDDVNNKAAIEVGTDWSTDTKTIIATNCTVNGFDVTTKGTITGSTLWGNKNSLDNDRLKVTVDGTTFVSNGLFTDDAGNFYVYNAAGLQSLKNWMDENSNKAFWGKTYNIMSDIDATDVTWNTEFMVPDSTTFNGITFNGNGHTISNLTINGQGLFTGTTMGNKSTVPATFNNITFDNATVTGGTHHNGVVWGEAYGSITLNNVSVINSKVSGGCNVGGLIGRNSESHATFTFKDCAVKNTTVEATQAADYAGASAFLGMALHIGDSCSANVIFEGTNVAEGNTLTTAEGMQGGGIYTYATWGEATWVTPNVVDTFTNYNSNN